MAATTLTDGRREICMRYLSELVAIPSVSGNENPSGSYIEAELTSMGWSFSRIPTGDGRFSLFAEMDDVCPAGHFLLAGHLDTVAPTEGWRTNPYEAVLNVSEVGEETIFGLGSCDMKAGLAIMLSVAKMASERRKRDDAKKGYPLSIAFLPDEEALSVGARALLDHGLPKSISFCLMPEPHFDGAIIGGPGKLLLRCRAKGRAAHGARPHEGVNAVTDLCSLVSALDRLALQSSPQMTAQPFVPLSISGGAECYSLSVPDACEAKISKQLVPGEIRDEVLRQMRGLATELGLRSEIVFETPPPYYPPYVIQQEGPYFARFEDISREVLGSAVPYVFGTSVSDANILVAEVGVPVLVFGPRGGNIHQANEWVDAHSVELCLDIYTRFLFGSSMNSN